jgi:STE24 endopeptidase
MNFKWIALIVMGVVFVFESVLHYLDTKSASRPIPKNVADIYDKEEYEKFLAYEKDGNKLALARHIVSYLISFLLIGLDSYAAIVNLVGAEGLYVAAITVVIADTLISSLVSVPFSYVRNMGIEEKYGFNKMTKKTFFVDLIKELIISVGLMCGLICVVVAVHQALGHWLVIVLAGVIMAFIVVLTFLQPVFTRIFNKLTPLEEGSLRTRLTELLEKNGCSVRQISVTDGSKRSTKANAYFGGFGKMKTIVLYDTLMEQMTEDEIVAVFAHEMGHNKHKDTLKLMGLNVVNVLLIAASLWAVVSLPEIYRDFGFEGVNYGFAFVLAGTVILSFLSPFVGLFTSGMTRRAEYAADKFAVDAGYGPELISALKKLAKNTLSCLSPHPVVVALTYSHPTISQRVEAMEKHMKK